MTPFEKYGINSVNADPVTQKVPPNLKQNDTNIMCLNIQPYKGLEY